MDFKSAVDLIIKDINELKNIVDGFKNYPNIPSLQIEIAKSKCRNAVEILELLKSVPVEPAGEESKEKETVQTKIIAGELIETFEKEEYFDIEDEPVTPEAPSTEKIDRIKAERKKEKPEAAIYAERFSSNPNSVYDRLSGTKQQSDSSKGKRSSNLFELIGLNDQFLFIREIFNGDSDLYNTAVNRLNNAKTFTEANEIIFDYIDDVENEAYKTLVDLVKRKFSVDG
jgi:hypothetical protein